MEETDQKNSIESAKYDTGIQFFFPCTCIYWAFFHGSGSEFSGSDPDFLANPDLDSGKKSPIRIRKTVFFRFSGLSLIRFVAVPIMHLNCIQQFKKAHPDPTDTF